MTGKTNFKRQVMSTHSKPSSEEKREDLRETLNATKRRQQREYDRHQASRLSEREDIGNGKKTSALRDSSLRANRSTRQNLDINVEARKEEEKKDQERSTV